MKIGRNDPCPCGSGSKFKKCCLAKDEARELESRQHIGQSTEAESPGLFYPADSSVDEWTNLQDDPEDTAGENPRLASEIEPGRVYPSVEATLPELAPADEAVVTAWWKSAEPAYDRRDADEMLRRVESILETHPALFPHLWLTEEFLFELGAELGRRRQWPVYARLLERLRREQPKAYSFVFGYFDYDLIVDRVASGRPGEISAFLSFFKEYPDSHPDQCHALTNLLAWRGLELPLYELAEAVAVPLLASRKVFHGGFAMDWLITREMMSFLEARDDSEAAATAVLERVRALSVRLDFKLTPSLPDIRRKLAMAAASPAVMELTQFKPRDHHFLSNLTWNFTGYLRARQPVSWVQARFAAERLDAYFWWHARRKMDPFQFKMANVEQCLVQTCREFLWHDGVRLVSSLQMLAWLADYLKEAGGISEAKRLAVRELARMLFEKGRKSVDGSDAAYRLCPTFDQIAPALVPLQRG
jgi:hypothetical protein